jgi:hypothetical protein
MAICLQTRQWYNHLYLGCGEVYPTFVPSSLGYLLGHNWAHIGHYGSEREIFMPQGTTGIILLMSRKQLFKIETCDSVRLRRIEFLRLEEERLDSSIFEEKMVFAEYACRDSPIWSLASFEAYNTECSILTTTVVRLYQQ